MLKSGDVDKIIKKIINPTLKANRFPTIKGRTAWSWRDDCIWVFTIRAVGGHHSFVTGWTSASLVVNLGICYTFFPEIQNVKKDENGLWYPKEWQCQRRAKLTCSYDQLKYTKDVKCNSSEKNRRDIWWIEPDGSNIDEVINDINNRFLKFAIKWFNEKSNKELALQEIKNFRGLHFDKIEI